MALNIRISRVNCVPGSYLEVLVVPESSLTYGDDCHIESLTTTVKGVSKSRVLAPNRAQNQAHESEINFFQMEPERFSSPDYRGRLLNALYGATFCFRFPADPVRCEHDPLRPPYHDAEPQALPPSGNHGGGNSIEYYLEICVTAGDGTKRVERKTKKTIEFTPTREPEAMEMPRSTITEQVDLMGATAPTGQTGTVFYLDYPTVIAPREPFTLDLAHKSLPSSAIFLHSWTVQLLESTCAMVSDTPQESWTTDYELASEIHTSNLNARPLIDAAPTIMLKELTLPGTCAPSFATLNIQHTYRLQVVMEFQSGGQSYTLRYTTGPVTVLALELGSKALEREHEEAYDFERDGDRVYYKGRLYPPTYARQFLSV